MRVLVADNLAETALRRLNALGFEVVFEPTLADQSLEEALSRVDPDVLVVRSTKVNRAHLSVGGRLALVVRAGAGVNTIDLETAANRAVYVANCPGRNAVAVAELAMGLLLALDRRIPDNVVDIRGGVWNKGLYGRASGLKGQTLGLIGFGRIGREVAMRARAFGMRVVAWSRSLTAEDAAEAGVERRESPVLVAAESDALSIHLASAPGTRGLVGAAVFGALKPGAMVVNTARADVVDHAALEHAMASNDIRFATDVLPDEPKGSQGDIDSRVGRHPSVYATHHIGASTAQAQNAVADAVCDVIHEFYQKGVVGNAVNLAISTEADHALIVRHRDQVGVLAFVLSRLRKAGINVQEMTNTIFAGGEAATACIMILGAPAEDVIQQIRGHEHVFQAVVQDRR